MASSAATSLQAQDLPGVTPLGFVAVGAPAPRIFGEARTGWRLATCAGLILADIAAVWCAFALTLSPGTAWLLALISMLYPAFTIAAGSCALPALRNPIAGAARAAGAWLLAAALAAALAAFFGRRDLLADMSILQGLFAAAFLMLARIRIGAGIGRRSGWRFTNELVLTDDPSAVTPMPGRRVLCATQLGIGAGDADPASVNRIGQMLQHCERVVLAVPLERRGAWLESLRGLDADIEYRAHELDHARPVALGHMDGAATLIVRRGLPLGARIAKRGFDLVVAIGAGIVLAPLIVAIAIAVRRDTPGPVFFFQTRVGRGNRHFRMVKFRTMRHAEVDFIGEKSVSRADARVTPLGRFLRNCSLDELPQLVNVIAGDMSIVGPRPHALGSRAGDALFWNVDARYWDRHAIKPGMTGLAQVRGQRGPTLREHDLTSRLESDLEYIAGWTLARELAILIRTIRVIVHANAF